MPAVRSAVPGHRDGTWIVALAASMWGTSALLREPLAQSITASTIVFYEHLVLVLVVSPWLVPALRAWQRSPARVKFACVLIGAGSSALATTLFTAAFRLGDPVTPQVLQKLQPLIAIALAAVVLRERVRGTFAVFAAPALVGAWLLTFDDPFRVGVTDLQAAALALGAAALWAGGTVFGRLATGGLRPMHTLTLRFAFGLPASGVIVLLLGTPFTFPAERIPNLVVLALIPGAAALALYYVGLRRAAAARATLAELMFPATAAVVGVVFLDARLGASQWLGFVIVLASVTALALHEGRSARQAVQAPPRAGDVRAR